MHLLNAIDNGGRVDYTGGPISAIAKVPTQITDAITAAFAANAQGPNDLLNGSQLVSQRFPSLTATGTVATGLDVFVNDRWFILPTGGTVTWTRVTAGLHSDARSPAGIELTGAAGITNVRYGIRLGRELCRALGALLANKNLTFGCKVRHSGSTGSITPNLLIRSTSDTGADSVATKFAAANMTTRVTQAFPGALAAGAEVSFTHTFDIGAMVDSQNGLEIYVDLLAMSAATIEFTLTDFFLSSANISTNLLPDDANEHLARCAPYYRKTFPYATQPAQNAGLVGALSESTPDGPNPHCFAWRFEPRLRGTSGLLTTYNPSAANALPRNTAGDDGAIGTQRLTDSALHQEFTASGDQNRAWYLHASLDCEWYD
jgi:hypothetical protein